MRIEASSENTYFVRVCFRKAYSIVVTVVSEEVVNIIGIRSSIDCSRHGSKLVAIRLKLGPKFGLREKARAFFKKPVDFPEVVSEVSEIG